MAETLSPAEQLAQANVRADEQLDFIKAMLEFDGKTRLNAKFFAPEGFCYTASFGGGRAIKFTSEGTDGSEATKHTTIKPFTFNKLEVTHLSPHRAEVKLRDPFSSRMAAFTLRQVVKIDQAGESVTISDADKLKFEAVGPEDIAA
jgi:hypothetical protein